MSKPQHLTPTFVRGLIELEQLAQDIKPDRAFPQNAGMAEFDAWMQDRRRALPYTRVELAMDEIVRGLPPLARAEVLGLIYIGDGHQTAEDFAGAAGAYARIKDADESMLEFSVWGVQRKLPRGYAVVWPDEDRPWGKQGNDTRE